MRVAFEAREAAWNAATLSGGDDWGEIAELQGALIRAGVIEDPTVIPDDHGEMDGSWARCLTADERDALGLAPGDVDLPTACDTLPAAFEKRCPERPPAAGTDDEEALEEPCEIAYVVAGRRYGDRETSGRRNVAAEADEWLFADGDEGVDRVARGPDATFVHVLGDGWSQLYAQGGSGARLGVAWDLERCATRSRTRRWSALAPWWVRCSWDDAHSPAAIRTAPLVLR